MTERCTNFIHLSVEVVAAATDMIENIGMLKGINRINREFEPYQMEDLRRAIKRAADAVHAYDSREASAPESSREEWNIALARSAKTVA